MSNCKWDDKCFLGGDNANGKCCGLPPTNAVLRWLDGDPRRPPKRRRRGVIPGQNAPGEDVAKDYEEIVLSDGDDEDDIPKTVTLKANGSEGSLTVPYHTNITWTTEGTAEGTVFFLGTMNGNNDQGSGVSAGTTSTSSPFSRSWGPEPGPEVMTRYVEVRNSNGTVIATSNTVTVTVEPPPTAAPCQLTWTKVAQEDHAYTFNDRVDLAFGPENEDPIANASSFKFLYDTTGLITFDTATFGDGALGLTKAGFYRCYAPPTPPPPPLPVISNLFNTGLGTPGSNDPNYTVIQEVTTGYVYNPPVPCPIDPDVGTYSPGWLKSDPTGRWIILPSIVGQFQVRTTFNLSGDPTQASLNFTIDADNGITDVLLNGKSTGLHTDLNHSATLAIPAGSSFVAGQNTLDFIVLNLGGPAAVIVLYSK